jgi:phosphoserine phosphatase RsbU/P
MVTAINPLREQLIDRREKLAVAVGTIHRSPDLEDLLEEVDAALQRMDDGSYGLCEVCRAPIETERLLANPLTRVCLGDLTPPQQRALEEDLELAARIQIGLLPDVTGKIDGWEIAYHYQPAGLVSGDYCDLISPENDGLHFIVGDVSGKGVAASILMAHLHAMFRTLVSVKLPLDKLVERASRVFCESTLPTHYATLVCGRAEASGAVEICNAGHMPPLLVRENQVTSIDSSGLPLGIFSSEQFSLSSFQMQRGETLFLYSDGLTETSDGHGQEYGINRLSSFLRAHHNQSPRSLVESCVSDLASFRAANVPADDLTMMALHRVQ